MHNHGAKQKTYMDNQRWVRMNQMFSTTLIWALMSEYICQSIRHSPNRKLAELGFVDAEDKKRESNSDLAAKASAELTYNDQKWSANAWATSAGLFEPLT